MPTNRFFISLILSSLICCELGFGQDPVWVKLEGSPPGRILSFNSKGDLFASSYLGLHRSSNNGANWTELISFANPDKKGFPYTDGINSILQFDDNRMFICTQYHGLQISTDNGGSWTALKNIPYSSSAMTVSRNKNGKIYFASGGGSYSSLDTGKTWQDLTQGCDFFGASSFATNRSNYILHSNIIDGKTGQKQISLYDEEMDTCSDVSFPNKLEMPDIVKSNSEEFFVRDYWGNLFYSTNNGVSWHQSTNRLSEYLRCIIETPSGNLLAAAENHGIFFSKDKGLNWHKIANQMNSRDIMSMALHTSGILYVGTGSGIFKSNTTADNLCK